MPNYFREPNKEEWQVGRRIRGLLLAGWESGGIIWRWTPDSRADISHREDFKCRRETMKGRGRVKRGIEIRLRLREIPEYADTKAASGLILGNESRQGVPGLTKNAT